MRKPETVTVVAELEVSSAESKEIIKTFDRAWHKALVMLTPVSIRFIGFTRAD